MHNDDFASSDHYRVGNSKLHTANAISLQTLRSSQEPIKLIGEFLDTLTHFMAIGSLIGPKIKPKIGQKLD